MNIGPEAIDAVFDRFRHLDITTADIEGILEAAAPYMLAGAWGEAITRATEVAWEHDASASSGVSQIPNPYRTTK